MAITINGSANTVAGLAVGGLPDGTTDADALASNAVTNVKVADDAIGVAELSATGTASSSTYLRGDNSWATVTSVGGATGVDFDDGVKTRWGNSNDFEAYYDGTNNISYLNHTNGSGSLILRGDDFKIQSNTGTETYITAGHNGAVKLYYDDTLKLETVSDRVKVTGKFECTQQLITHDEFDMLTNGNKYIDTAHNTLYFRRVAGADTGHSTHCNISYGGVWSADFNDTSDEKLKKNIATITDGAISKVKQLRPVTFDWIDTDHGSNVSGFVAQEVKTVLPNLVYGTEYDSTLNDPEKGTKGGIKSEGYSINTVGIVAHLTKALQEAITKIETLETKVAALEAG